MIPGKRYTPELVLSIAWRRKWLILIPAVVVAAVACGITYMLPDQYRSEASILVVPQQVPENYVRPVVTTKLSDRLRSINQQVRSRTKLERIIEELNLYPERRKTDIMQDIIDDMAAEIRVNISTDDVFRVSFTADNPRMAKDVTDRVTTFFIDESLKDRTMLAEGASDFLAGQVGDSERKLREIEQKLQEYRRRHDGELPDQTNTNQQGLLSAQSMLQQVNMQLDRDRDLQGRKELELAELTALADAAAAAPPVVDVAAAPDLRKTAELTKLRAELQDLRSKGYSDGHPEIDRREKLLPTLEQEAAEEAASLTPLAPQGPAPNTVAARRAKDVDNARADRDRLNRQIDNNLKARDELTKRINEYQRRIEIAPMRDTELLSLTRDYATLKDSYDSLTRKRIDSDISAGVERRQMGEQFRILDPARLPEKPSSPNRQRMYLMSVVLALLVGLGAAAGAEYLDRGLRSEDDVRLALALPVLATIPIIGPKAKTSRRWKLLGASAAAVVLTGAAGAAWLVLR